VTAQPIEPDASLPPTPERPADPSDITQWTGQIWEGDCIPLMNAMPEASVDVVLADLPYGTTRNKWDSVIPLEDLWAAYAHVLRPEGCVVLTAAQPFTSILVASNLNWFKYEWIWSKTIGSGQLNVKKQPLRTHESVLVFAPKKAPYFPQMEAGTPYKAQRKGTNWDGRGYNSQTDHVTVNTGTRYPKSVLHVPNPRIKGGHPTQKPLALFEYLIRTYTEPGQIVLDNVMGSGTTAEAAQNTARLFVGMEQDAVYLASARARVGIATGR
jgi:DNA modification methylase